MRAQGLCERLAVFYADRRPHAKAEACRVLGMSVRSFENAASYLRRCQGFSLVRVTPGIFQHQPASPSTARPGPLVPTRKVNRDLVAHRERLHLLRLAAALGLAPSVLEALGRADDDKRRRLASAA